MPRNELISLEVISVDIGDLRVEFIGSPSYACPKGIFASPLHKHMNFELQYTISGTFSLNVDTEEMLDVPQDSFLLIPPQIPHSNTDQPGQRLAVSFTLKQIRNRSTPLFSEFSYYTALFGSLHSPLLLHDSAISACLHQLIRLSILPENIHKHKLLLTFMFIQMADRISALWQATGKSNPHQQNSQYHEQYFVVEHFINVHYNQKTSADEIAKIMHISRRQLDRIIRHITGKTFAILLLERRMTIAKSLVCETTLPLHEIALKTGYNSYAGFYIAFKQFFGTAPENMRKYFNDNNNP